MYNPSLIRTDMINTFDQQSDQRALAKLSPVQRPYPLNAICPRPIPNSYWATPLILACEYPWSPKNPYKPKLDALLKAGVRTFIDLTECGELSPYSSILSGRAELLGIEPKTIEYYNFPIRDRSLPPSVEYLYSVLDVLRDNEIRGRISAVHCRGGIGRTGMVIGCWLVQSGIAKDGDEALQIIAKEWSTVEKCKRFPHSPETGPQFEFVQRWIRREESECGGISCGNSSEMLFHKAVSQVYPFKALQLVFIALLLGFMFFFMTALGRL